MEVKCDKCGSSTSPKEITSKKTGKNYTVYECNGGCMNGKFRYSRFAPSDGYVTPSSTPGASAGSLASSLKSIDAKLNQILKLLQAKQGSGPSGGGFDDMPPSELEPDNEIPL